MRSLTTHDMRSRILSVTVGILISLSLAPTAGAQNMSTAPAGPGAQPVGEVRQIQGTASVIRGGETLPKALNESEQVYVQDLILTQGNSKLWWNSGSMDPQPSDASLGAESSLKFFGYQSQGADSSFVGGVERGPVRFIKKLQETDPASSFIVETPTARVQVMSTEEPADFVVEVLDVQRTRVTVLWGKVMVKNIAEDLTRAWELRSCRTILVEHDKEPSAPTKMPSDRLADLIAQTTIPGTLPMDVPSCQEAAVREAPIVYVPPVEVPRRHMVFWPPSILITPPVPIAPPPPPPPPKPTPPNPDPPPPPPPPKPTPPNPDPPPPPPPPKPPDPTNPPPGGGSWNQTPDIEQDKGLPINKAQGSLPQQAKAKVDINQGKVLPVNKAQGSLTQAAKSKVDIKQGKGSAGVKTSGTQVSGQINKTSIKKGSNVGRLGQKPRKSSLKLTGGHPKSQTTRVARPNVARPSPRGIVTSQNSVPNVRRR